MLPKAYLTFILKLHKVQYAFLGQLSPVAQLAEQVAVNHWVRGSNPRGGVR